MVASHINFPFFLSYRSLNYYYAYDCLVERRDFLASHAATAKSLQSCPTLCNPIDSSPPGSPVPGILQERTLEWVAISFSNAWKWKVKGKSLSRVWPSAAPWTAAFQAPPSMEFSRQEYWSGVSLPSPHPLLNVTKLWPVHFKMNYSVWLFGKDPDPGKDWGKKEKRITEVGWHHWVNGHELGQTLGDGEG